MLAVAVAIIALPAPRSFHKDEGGYLLALSHLANGRFEVLFDKLTSPTLPVLVLAAPFYRTHEQSLGAVRALNVALSLLCLAAFFLLLGTASPEKAPWKKAALAAAFLGLNPLFYRYTHIFTGDTGFLTFCLLTLLFARIGLEGANDTAWLAAAAACATMAVYTRQFGMILPVVVGAALLGRHLRSRTRPGALEMFLVVVPWIAFVPLGLYFRARYGSFLVPTTTVAPAHHRLGLHLENLLWCVNFLGVFTLPFAPWVLGTYSFLWKRKSLLVILLGLSPLVLLAPVSVASTQGGMGKILMSLPAVRPLVPVLVVASQYMGLAVLAILVRESLDGKKAAQLLVLFTGLYMGALTLKGGYLLLHYATPLVPAMAYVVGTAWKPEHGAVRTLCLLMMLAGVWFFSFSWAMTERAAADASYEAVRLVKQKASETDLVFCLSSTALWHFNEGLMTARAEDSAFIIESPESPVRIEVPEGFSLLGSYPVTLYGLPLGSVKVYEKIR